MNKKNLKDLLVTKFYNSDVKYQKELVGIMLMNIDSPDRVIDFLNGKKLSTVQDITEGDYIFLKVGEYYPSVDKNYYEENALLINNLYIRVQVTSINVINGYVIVNYYTSNGKFEDVELYTGYIPNQKELLNII